MRHSLSPHHVGRNAARIAVAILFDWGGTLAHAHTRENYLYHPNPVNKMESLKWDTLRTLEGLKQRGYVLGIVSNTSHPPFPMHEALAVTDMDKYFSVVVLHSERGNCSKPCSPLFQKACDRLGVSASQCVYVGNDYMADVVGAAGAGMRTVLVKNVGEETKHGSPEMGGIRPNLIIRDLSELLYFIL